MFFEKFFIVVVSLPIYVKVAHISFSSVLLFYKVSLSCSSCSDEDQFQFPFHVGMELSRGFFIMLLR
jgi:hypothetical protein